MIDKPQQGGPKMLGPYQIILRAYTYFKAQTIDEDGLVKVALTANCPNADVAKRLLQKMVDDGYLVRSVQGGKSVYSIVPGGPTSGLDAKN
jgi:predicted transcriptional regulator